METNLTQGVLVVSFGKLNEIKLIKNIIGSDFDEAKLIKKKVDKNSFLSYPFNLNTKYYDAEINFYQTDNLNNLNSSSLIDPIQALIVYFDSNDEKSYETFISWSSIIDDFNPEIRLLICDAVTNKSVVTHTTILKWCINHEFELIQLEPEEEEDDEFENEFNETKGVDRIVQALSAHTWPQMTLKKTACFKPFEFEGISSKKYNDQTKFTPEEVKKKSEINDKLSLNEITSKMNSIIEDNKIIFESINKDDENSFDLLFTRFQDLKKKAETMKGEERRIYAEKVTIAFWQSIGGNEEEILGLID